MAKVFIIVIIVLICDQWLKIHIKTAMELGETRPILGASWAFLHFVENNGMAFGIDFGGKIGKLALSIFRIIAVTYLWIYIIKIYKEGASFGILSAFGLIFAGACGNIIDSAIYGIIFSASNYHGGLAQLFPAEGGYSTFLFGKVVDMFYFPIIDTNLPSWMPIVGGRKFEFFRPVFNIADASISIGVVLLIIFYNKFFTNFSKNE